jgi:tRNA pseudouridine55 synthase
MKRKGLPLNGWFNLDKPVGLTSTQAMAKVRWLLKAEKAGHGGTLDPLASGILPIALGEATKTVAYVMDALKTYRFTVTWGESRATDDGEGEVLARSAQRPAPAAIAAALPAFVGEISQRPPIYSALKVAGERAYDLARAGEKVELDERIVFVESFELLACPTVDRAVFEVVCGKGTYIRALARDLAEKLGTLGYVSELRRLAVGRFTTENAIPLDVLEEKVHNTPAETLLLPLETALDDIPALAITELEAQRLRLGQRVSLLQAQHRDRLMALPEVVRIGSDPVVMLCEGRAVGLGEVVAGELRTVRLFNL